MKPLNGTLALLMLCTLCPLGCGEESPDSEAASVGAVDPKEEGYSDTETGQDVKFLKPVDAETLASWTEHVYPNGVRFSFPPDLKGDLDAVDLLLISNRVGMVMITQTPANTETDPAGDWIANNILKMARVEHYFSPTRVEIDPPVRLRFPAGQAALYRISQVRNKNGQTQKVQAFILATIRKDTLYQVISISSSEAVARIAMEMNMQIVSTFDVGDPPKPKADDS